MNRKPTNPFASLETPVEWTVTGDALVPYWADVDGEVWQVRVNDFPDEHLYTLLVHGSEREHFDDWPTQWSRPSMEAGRSVARGQRGRVSLELSPLERKAMAEALAVVKKQPEWDAHPEWELLKARVDALDKTAQ